MLKFLIIITIFLSLTSCEKDKDRFQIVFTPTCIIDEKLSKIDLELKLWRDGDDAENDNPAMYLKLNCQNASFYSCTGLTLPFNSDNTSKKSLIQQFFKNKKNEKKSELVDLAKISIIDFEKTGDDEKVNFFVGKNTILLSITDNEEFVTLTVKKVTDGIRVNIISNDKALKNQTIDLNGKCYSSR